MTGGFLALFLLLLAKPGPALPPSVAAELPALQAAERALEDSTLALAAARREALGPEEAVAEARAQADHWWGDWWLRHRLSQLKLSLDQVEAARQAQVRAHALVFALLSGLEEELRGSLEARAARNAVGLGADWAQEQAWRERVEALEQGLERTPGTGPGEHHLLGEARLGQLRRDERLAALLQRLGVLSSVQVRHAEASLQASEARWRGRLGP